MADIAMNAFAPATDGAYIYAEASNGSQVKIKKTDLIRIFCNATVLEIVDLNTFNSGGVFHVITFTNGPSGNGNYAYLENLTSGGSDRIQRLNLIISGKSFKRTKINEGWSEWKEI